MLPGIKVHSKLLLRRVTRPPGGHSWYNIPVSLVYEDQNWSCTFFLCVWTHLLLRPPSHLRPEEMFGSGFKSLEDGEKQSLEVFDFVCDASEI